MFNRIESVSLRREEINDYFRYFKQTHDLEMLRQMRVRAVYNRTTRILYRRLW